MYMNNTTLSYNQERVKTQFFIDTYGKIHRYKGEVSGEQVISYHYQIAKTLYPELNHPDDFLKSLGWVLVGSTVYKDPFCDKIPTQAQINTLDRLDLLSRFMVLENGYYLNYLRNIDKFE